jgi:hypothetical protein
MPLPSYNSVRTHGDDNETVSCVMATLLAATDARARTHARTHARMHAELERARAAAKERAAEREHTERSEVRLTVVALASTAAAFSIAAMVLLKSK